jgi:alanyl-tRNA synthetase
LKSSEVRSAFIEFFKSKNHSYAESSSLIPENDPTLLFANAGMNQFKDYFTGKASPDKKRKVTIQKCVRAGGKHNDLENVGFTARHHTFFEMLGNFSFGDYFKVDAIKFAWEFLTEKLNIPSEKLYITVHEKDDEAYRIWNEVMNIPTEKIFRKGDSENFWEMGEVGPCGPCSEIFFDHGEKHSSIDFNDEKNKDLDLLDDEVRYVEIWNLVFMQFERDKSGTLSELPSPCVDTGAGLERIAAALQGKYWNYDSDVFSLIIQQLETISGQSYSDKKYTNSFRVVADHIRSSTMLITDGVIPSNEGRGYVLRRIIRRAVRHLRELGIKEVSFYKLVTSVFDDLGSQYKQNSQNSAMAEKILEVEERKFLATLELGLKVLDESILKLNSKNNVLSGDIAFKLYDTYGFPLDLTEVIAAEKNFSVDVKNFHELMEEQRKRSKKSRNSNLGEDLSIYHKAKETYGATLFKGYETLETKSKLLKILNIGTGFALIFDQSPFYGESGGQIGDRGKIFLPSKSGDLIELVEIIDTQKPIEELHVHYVKDSSMLEENQVYTLSVNKIKRELIKKNHSATHLLQSALIMVLGDHVKQAGSVVSDEKLRFDFTHLKALTEKEILKVEQIVNENILKNNLVNPSLMNKDKAIEKGAMALFGEKYGEIVRVVTMGEYSTELCGGTHVENTGEIFHFSIITETALASGVRRIEALTGPTSMKRLQKRSKILKHIEIDLSTKADKISERVLNLKNELRLSQKELTKINEKLIAFESDKLFNDTVDINNGLVFTLVKVPLEQDIKKLSDLYIGKKPNGITLMYQDKKGKTSILLRTNKINQSLDCSNLLKSITAVIGGRGGGKKDMAQGSAGDVSSLINNKNKIIEIINEKLS